MRLEDLPFKPIRGSLYDSRELLEGFDPARPQSLVQVPDFQTYRYFVMKGRAAPADPVAGMMEALHDNSILEAMLEFLRQHPKIAAIMGGHDEPRGSPTYRQVVTISRKLSAKGYLMASGGGPGAMEATHLGALVSGASQTEVERLVTRLARRAAKLPDSHAVVNSRGVPNRKLVDQLHAWVVPAYELLGELSKGGRPSLGVPTWYYGHEPLTPLATRIAKYFQNSVREDVLLALATNGIVFTRGKAGTLQEVFQSANKNYYLSGSEPFAPMVFFDRTYWTEELPVYWLLRNLFVNNGRGANFRQHVLFTDDVDEAVDFITGLKPRPQRLSDRLEALGLSRPAALL
jgi:predicted Rossmann-fold nucleotide-binding protein